MYGNNYNAFSFDIYIHKILNKSIDIHRLLIGENSMFRNIIWLIIFLILLVACQINNRENLSAIAENYYQERAPLYPVEATQAGDNRYNDLYPNDISQSFKKELEAFYSKYQDLLSKIDRNALSIEDQLTYDALQWECDINLDHLKFPYELMPINQMFSPNLFFGQLASGSGAQPFKTVKDYENWLKRVDSFIVWCDTAIANMKIGIRKGYVLPKSLIKKVIPQMASLMNGPVEEHLFYRPVDLMLGSFSSEEKDKITSEYTKMIRDKIIPLYQRLYNFISEDYLPAGRETSGYGALPNGDAWYKQRIKNYTTTGMTAEEIHQLGLSEVERISEDMEEVKAEVGFNGELKDFFNYVRNKKELMPFNTAEQVIEHCKSIYQTLKPNLKKLFDVMPKTPFEIRRTEAFREKSASAEYNQGSIDGTRPGIFYVPVPDAKKYNIFSDESLFLHEVIPGHHFQISLQQENDALPKFRKTLWYSAYGEGWALYSESLGKELGLYEDPYQYFGMLSAEMHRAIRLVVDTGIHSKGWTREQAIQYSIENEAESLDNIESEIERYMAGPGQALSYKIGQLKIRELRSRAAKQLVDKFDIQLFHDQILESGCVPLEILEAKINRWIEGQKVRPASQ